MGEPLRFGPVSDGPVSDGPAFELSWRSGLDPVAIGAVRAFVAAVTEADGTAPLSEDALLHVGDADTVVLWAASQQGELAGVATLDLSDPETGSAEFAIGTVLTCAPDVREAGPCPR